MNEKEIIPQTVQQDPWEHLKQFTRARIALGRTGISVPLKETLQFKLAHAYAKDAVFSALDIPLLQQQLAVFDIPVLKVKSLNTNRQHYLQRPDLGKKLTANDEQQLQSHAKESDIAIVVADGLSATAINQHTAAILGLLIPLLLEKQYNLAPIVLAEQARVALGDEIATCLKAKLVIVFIGERPGLSVSDSLGVYITYKPSPGFTDEKRNCISNIHGEGLSYEGATRKIEYLVSESMRLQLSGVQLKDNDLLLL
jgi:ethanolamine ammonia-lyase small subunit